jgi:hypothetical protein
MWPWAHPQPGGQKPRKRQEATWAKGEARKLLSDSLRQGQGLRAGLTRACASSQRPLVGVLCCRGQPSSDPDRGPCSC